MKRSIFFLLLLTVWLWMGARAAYADPPDDQHPSHAVGDAAINLALTDVPMAFQRRAAQLIEDMRGSALAPGWQDAYLDDTVRPLYRPDLEEPAYYEFRVLSNNEPAGYIILATGEHDFPIAHWNFAGEPPTYLIENKAQEQDQRVARFYKLDVLDYAGEDAEGELAATLGDLPIKVVGLDPAWLEHPPEMSSAIWTPSTHPPDDSTPPTSGNVTLTGPQDAPIELEAWSSWQELKQGYQDAYGFFLEELRQDAQEAWEAQREAEGEIVLAPGETYTLSLLCSGHPPIDIAGPGAAMVQTTLLSRSQGASGLRILVQNAVFGQELPLDITVTCPSREPFTTHFLIIENDATLFLPSVGKHATTGLHGVLLDSAQKLPSPLGETAVQNEDWYWAWAGTNELTLYTQIPFHPPPASSSCTSGCGATAWAMLFGWADYEAENPLWNYWHARYGIYREHGGLGKNVRAPLHMDDGVRFMIWEIKKDIKTWCVGGSAPTFPWRMWRAAYYLEQRSGTTLVTHYNVLGYNREARLRNYARNSIFYRKTPAIIGIGWLKHYPLAHGYYWRSYRKHFLWWHWTTYDRYFWVNQGWGGPGNGWVPARTWFAGEIYP